MALALNGKAKEKHLSDALAEKVIKYVEEVGYKPNQLAALETPAETGRLVQLQQAPQLVVRSSSGQTKPAQSYAAGTA